MNICGLVVNHRTYDLTKTLMDGLAHFYPGLPVLLVDNGSGDESAAYIHSHPYRIMNEINVGHGYAMDQGIISVNADLVFCFDTDCEVIKGGFIEPMVKQFEDNPNLYALGAFHLVNGGGIDSFIQEGDGKEYPYVHPSTGLYRRSMYLDLPPFRHHGSPCIDNMVEAARRGYEVKEFPNIRDYVTHPWAGTRDRMEAGGWSLEIGLTRPFVSFVTRTSGSGEGLLITLKSTSDQQDIDFENVLISRGGYYEHRNRVFGEYVFAVDEGESIADPTLISRIKRIVYNNGWPDIIEIGGGRAIRREVFRRFSRDLKLTTGTVYKG